MEGSQAEEGSINERLHHIRKHKTMLQYINTETDYEVIRNYSHELCQAISDCDDGEELSVIFKMYRINDDRLPSIYSSIHSSLQEELAKVGPYTIEPLESVANGLSLRKNTIDLKIYCSTSQLNHNTSRNLSKVLESSKRFSGVVLHAIYPIIKCFHIGTERRLRITICETYDDHQSIEFINQLKQTDNRITELMIFLKIWFKNLYIHAYACMSEYCLMTLIIFYLQNTNPPILVSMKTIQTNILNDINSGMNSRFISMDPTQNIHQLIKGFFKFYSSLDFENVIIAPYLGRVINKDDFRNKVFKYPEYEAQMEMLAAFSNKPAQQLETCHPLCVQDMYYLNRNIAKSEGHKFLSKLDFQFVNKCISIAYKKCCEPKISVKTMYKSLLSEIIEQLFQTCKHMDSLGVAYAFDIIPRKNELKSLARFADQPLNVRKLWVKAYIAAIPQIITAVYKIDMALLLPTGYFEFKKIEETEELPLPFEWSIWSSVDLWTERNMQENNETFVESLLAETETLYAERRHSSKFAVKIKGSIIITISKNFSSLNIAVYCRAKHKVVRNLVGTLLKCMQAYNLTHRIHLIENQLQPNI